MDIAVEAALAVDTWESKLFESVSGGAGLTDLSQLGAFRANATALRTKVDELDAQIRLDLHRAVWSTGHHSVVDLAVDDEIENARGRIEKLRSDVSDAFVAANTVAIAVQLDLAQRQQVQVNKLQSTATRLTAFLLVPGLVAAVFGANVSLPGSNGSDRLWLMLGTMVLGAALTFGLLQWRNSNG